MTSNNGLCSVQQMTSEVKVVYETYRREIGYITVVPISSETPGDSHSTSRLDQDKSLLGTGTTRKADERKNAYVDAT